MTMETPMLIYFKVQPMDGGAVAAPISATLKNVIPGWAMGRGCPVFLIPKKWSHPML